MLVKDRAYFISFEKLMSCELYYSYNKTRRSQKLTPRQPKGNKIRGFKVRTTTHRNSKVKMQAQPSRVKTSEPMSQGMYQKKFRKIYHPKMDISPYLSNFSKKVS